MRVIYRKIRHAHYLYIKRNVEKVWGARYTLGALYLSKNTVFKNYEFCKIITLKERASTHVDVIYCTLCTSFFFFEPERAGTFLLFVFQIFFEGIMLTEILGEL